MGICVSVAALGTACSKKPDPSNPTSTGTSGENATKVNHEEKAETNSLFLGHDGKVVQTQTYVFDKDYYDVKEFEEFVKEKVISYNVDTSGLSYAYADDVSQTLPAALTSVSQKENEVLLKLTFADSKNFMEFNRLYQDMSEEAYFEACPVGEQSLSAYDTATKFVQAKSGDTVDAMKALSATTEDSSKTYFIGIDFASEIYTEGNILYVSPNVSVNGDNFAVTDGTAKAYIVFE